MENSNLWNEGDTVLLRGVYDRHPTYAQAVRVIKDTPEETALYIWPGAECMAPAGYIRNGHIAWDRWHETMTNTLNLEKYLWHTNRFLILLEPKKYFSTIHIWNAETNEFSCYYINFQLPFQRTALGFDTCDLDLDIVIEPSYNWQWKDADEYQHGIQVGGIKMEWVNEIERARKEIATRLQSRSYPLDGSWLSWEPDSNWPAPKLPANWDVISE